MKRNPPSKRDLAALCAEVDQDDGVDPKRFFRKGGKREKVDRKTLQLCKQVAETLNLVLAGECDDDVLRELQVQAVLPAPNASQLLVVVSPALAGGPDERAAMERLAAAVARLRAEVARAITRRRAPKLLFRFVPGPAASNPEATQQ